MELDAVAVVRVTYSVKRARRRVARSTIVVVVTGARVLVVSVARIRRLLSGALDLRRLRRDDLFPARML